MAAAKVVFHPGASEDYAAAFAWYYSRGSALASDFEREIERAIRLISQNPLRWPRFDEQSRRLIIRKFPYAIIYEPYDEQVIILAVAHGKTKTLLLARTRNAAIVSRPTSFWVFPCKRRSKMNNATERFMRMAIAEARKGMREGNHPYGSVIVKDGTVLVRAHSTGALSHDIAAHADMSAARKLSKKAKRRDVKGCTVYATGEPCPMCSAALAAMHISKLFIAANYRHLPPQMNRGRKRPGKITYKEIFKEYGLKVKVKEGVLKDEVLKMYDEYVKNNPGE